jgi:hypothetical protein
MAKSGQQQADAATQGDPVRWPEGAAAILEIPAPTLTKRRADGDAPRLFAIGRHLFTTREALHEWVLEHEVAPGFRARAPRREVAALDTPPRGHAA